ncbi:hypothetical protein L873DRAFT_1824677 [Choiromyces venosus 120613-1]|uniref:Tc1-like transposase DDE domain-containing protein n=1 Tax=Choiromyces venosus 120613-1 TaxID=1336337 RepID=A0A3N4K9E4_9PEZI|nr:hypothetical protein L873DRAFT_1824677 [Choiromyces venosus 120613-1]
MCWGMIKWNYKGPFYIWETETEKDRSEARDQIAILNENASNQEAQLNKEWKESEEGIDSWRYIKYVCRPLLWPVCQQLLREDQEFILMEDNAPGHDCWYTNQERVKEGVNKVNWPPNSPDFNPIERICVKRMREVLVEE